MAPLHAPAVVLRSAVRGGDPKSRVTPIGWWFQAFIVRLWRMFIVHLLGLWIYSRYLPGCDDTGKLQSQRVSPLVTDSLHADCFLHKSCMIMSFPLHITIVGSITLRFLNLHGLVFHPEKAEPYWGSHVPGAVARAPRAGSRSQRNDELVLCVVSSHCVAIHLVVGQY